MCQIEGCKYIEIITDIINKKKWYIHYRIEGKYFLKEIYRENVEYNDPSDSDRDTDSDTDSDK